MPIRKFTSINDLPSPQHWHELGRERIYASPWVNLDLVDIQPNRGDRYKHHVVDIPYKAVCVIVHHAENGVLMLYRHRFITGTTGFELPAGGVSEGETAETAAAREVLEETGWAVSSPKVFLEANASDGVSTQKFSFAIARAESEVEEPRDRYEFQELYWVPVERLQELIAAGMIPSCSAIAALMYAIAEHLIHPTKVPRTTL
ncbi:NUDIX hydrolase [Thalassobaculum salexigens]|uniref:NUDIX hydrolase n=1 Tax=Thalassobaculum salexigens TaxID=455360 RepID=UPI000A039613|nr:NUDIX hydrolase [Thalassobaculum salexigens]